jgi:ABC-type sugar transport system permease subunit
MSAGDPAERQVVTDRSGRKGAIEGVGWALIYFIPFQSALELAQLAATGAATPYPYSVLFLPVVALQVIVWTILISALFVIVLGIPISLTLERILRRARHGRTSFAVQFLVGCLVASAVMAILYFSGWVDDPALTLARALASGIFAGTSAALGWLTSRGRRRSTRSVELVASIAELTNDAS